ncbi:hypothetical protein Hanom_Chr00s006498g01734321 [Helianthus anomalus]
MSWFNLNYVFGESFNNNTSTFILESTVITVMGVRIMKTVMVSRPNKKTMAITLSLVMPRTYNKTLVSILTPKSHWVASNPLTRKFRTKLIRCEG